MNYIGKIDKLNYIRIKNFLSKYSTEKSKEKNTDWDMFFAMFNLYSKYIKKLCKSIRRRQLY